MINSISVNRIAGVFFILLSFNAFAQDRIILESGDTLSVVVANYNKKDVNYVGYNDPEFKSESQSTERVSKIIFENGKVVDFHKAKDPGAFVALTLNSAIPVSDFANDGLNDGRSGFAKPGSAIGLEGRYPIYKFIGISGGFNAGKFAFNEDSYFKQLNGFKNNAQGAKDTLTASGNISNYQFATLSIGPDIAFKLGSRIRFSIPLEFAFISLKNKGNSKIKYVNKLNETVSEETVNSNGNGIGYSTGIRFDYMLGAKIAIGLQAKAYYFSVVNEVTDEVKSISASVNRNYTSTQNVMYMQLGVTARYYFK